MSDSVSFTMPRELRAVREATKRLRTTLGSRGLPAEFLDECELALVEACNNAVQHGGGTTDLRIDARLGENWLEMRVWDSGPGFELPAKPELPPDDAERGRGLCLIHSLMDAVEVQTVGGMHCLQMRKTLPGGGS